MIITSELKGQFGNRLFLSAYALALARATGQRQVDFTIHEYAHFFPAARQRLPQLVYRIFRRIIRDLLRLYAHTRAGQASSITLDTPNGPAYSLEDPAFIAAAKARWITHIRGIPDMATVVFDSEETRRAIRERFTPDSEILEVVQKHLYPIRSSSDVVIGVHIRRGDYSGFRDGIFFYSPEVYRDIMQHLIAFFPGRRVAFLVCSNEPQEPSFFAPLQVILGPGTIFGDLYALAACDYIIGAPSTFSLWAAFYGKKYLHLLRQPKPPASLADFVIPDGHFECLPSRSEMSRLQQLRRAG